MVSFVVSNARLLVTDTAVCSKQDFATAIPDPPKPQPNPQPKAKVTAPKGPTKTNPKAKKTQSNTGPQKVVLVIRNIERHQALTFSAWFQLKNMKMAILIGWKEPRDRNTRLNPRMLFLSELSLIVRPTSLFRQLES